MYWLEKITFARYAFSTNLASQCPLGEAVCRSAGVGQHISLPLHACMHASSRSFILGEDAIFLCHNALHLKIKCTDLSGAVEVLLNRH